MTGLWKLKFKYVRLPGKAFAEDELGRKQDTINSFRKFIDLASAEYAEQIEYARKRLKELEENEPTPRAKARGFREQKTDIPPLCSGRPFIPEFETSGFSGRFYKCKQLYEFHLPLR
jgi:hypothetical protein